MTRPWIGPGSSGTRDRAGDDPIEASTRVGVTCIPRWAATPSASRVFTRVRLPTMRATTAGSATFESSNANAPISWSCSIGVRLFQKNVAWL